MAVRRIFSVKDIIRADVNDPTVDALCKKIDFTNLVNTDNFLNNGSQIFLSTQRFPEKGLNSLACPSINQLMDYLIMSYILLNNLGFLRPW